MDELVELQKDYEKYRWFITSKGNLVLGGKNAINNDDLMKRVSTLLGEYTIMHTSEPSSPFCVIIAPRNKVTEDELNEVAVFTASFSKAWKMNKRNISVDVFKKSQIRKDNLMKNGTWGVVGKIRKIKVDLGLVLTIQIGKIRAVPKRAAKDLICEIMPGEKTKEEYAKEILKENKAFKKEEILSALPSGGFK